MVSKKSRKMVSKKSKKGSRKMVSKKSKKGSRKMVSKKSKSPRGREVTNKDITEKFNILIKKYNNWVSEGKKGTIHGLTDDIRQHESKQQILDRLNFLENLEDPETGQIMDILNFRLFFDQYYKGK